MNLLKLLHPLLVIAIFTVLFLEIHPLPSRERPIEPCAHRSLVAERRLASNIQRERTVIATLPELTTQIIDCVRQHGRVTMADMIRVTGTSRNTLKDHFRSLVEKQHLTRHGSGKDSWYPVA
jgi:Fic family protein